MRRAASISLYEAECEVEDSVCAKVIHTGRLESQVPILISAQVINSISEFGETKFIRESIVDAI